MNPDASQLCIADEKTFWPHFSWTDFAAWPDRDRALVVLPLAGGHSDAADKPFDQRETMLMCVLRDAIGRRRETSAAARARLVLPPLRFVADVHATGDERSIFAVDFELAYALVFEVAESIAAAGFRRIVLFNASLANEELCDVVARDLRIERELEVYCINLRALGEPDEETGAAEKLAALFSEIEARGRAES